MNDETGHQEPIREIKFPVVDLNSWFYKNCKTQRRREAKICQVCPFRRGIEEQENNESVG